jgi:hypothetical protein
MLMSPLDTKADQFGIEFKCRWEKGMDEYPVCDFGPDAETADHSVVIYGNSHSQAWMPAMRKLSRVLNFHLTSYLSQSCYPATADVVQSFNEEDKQRCIDSWPVNFQRIVELNPDLVVMANRAPMTSYESWEVVLQQFADAGIQVLVIRDFPSPYRAFPAEERNNIPDCVASVGDDYQKCDGVRSIWLNDDPAALAAYALNSPLVQVLDLTDAFCNETICWSVVGGLIVYWDSDHLSGTYAYSLWPYLEPVISELLSKR